MERANDEKLATCELDVREWVTSVSEPIGDSNSPGSAAASASATAGSGNANPTRFRIRDVEALRARVDRYLLEPLGLLPSVQPPLQPPLQHAEPLARDRVPFYNPLAGQVPGGLPIWPGYGRGDLVPGGAGVGGMFFDPRRGGSGFPGVPGPFDPTNPNPFGPVGPPAGSVPPGARYDPPGPFGGNPNPDHFRPPQF